MTERRKVILLIVGVVAFIYLGVYSVFTPFIRGVVVDETTKQPVEDAWVMATAWVGVRTIAGDGGGIFFISRPHLRTGKGGVFYVFPKLHLSVPTLFTFGNMKKGLGIAVRTKDGGWAQADITKKWWHRLVFVTLPVTHTKREERAVCSELSALCGYCTKGGYSYMETTGGYFNFVHGLRTELCDNWELEYTMSEHEKFLAKLSTLKNASQRVDYARTLYSLALLHKRKGEVEKALELVKRVRDFDLEQGSSWNQRMYNDQIAELDRH